MVNFAEIWANISDVLFFMFFESDWGRLASAAIAVTGGLVAWAILGSWGKSVALKITQRTSHWIDNAIVDALEEPIKVAPIVLGAFLAVIILGTEGPMRVFTDKLFGSIAIALVFWTLARLVERVLMNSRTIGRRLSGPAQDWIRSAARWLILFIGGAAILEEWGIAVAPILAGLGIFGAAIALGAQDLFKNLIGGLVILMENRFKPGDWILVDDVVEGNVEQIGFRSTRVRRFDKGPVFVPNAKLADNAVTNFSRMTHRRIYWKIGLIYSTSAPQLRQVRDKLLDFVMTDDRFAKPPEVPTFVYVDSFNDSSIDLMLYCFTKTIVWGEWLDIKQDLALKLKEIVEETGTDFAFPSQSLYIAGIPGAAERFKPPAGGGKPKAAAKSRKSVSKSAAKPDAPEKAASAPASSAAAKPRAPQSPRPPREATN